MNPVMCITKDTLHLEEGVNTLTLNPINIQFIHRNIVDSTLPKYHAVGTMFLQVLPYIVVKCGNEYLTYARKGNEHRLHGKRSMGFGGHVDFTDWSNTIKDTLCFTAQRELVEELGLYVEDLALTDDYIFTNYDNVSQVHLGAIGIVEIQDKSMVKPSVDEVLDPQWLDSGAIRGHLDNYERWSQILIKHLDK